MKKFLRFCVLACCCTYTFIAAAQVPVLNSYPSARAVILLDFDGHNVEGTSWNYNGPINCAAATLDAAQITEIVNRVAEDYRPFNINITTDPARYTAAPQLQRMRVIVTPTHQWYGSSAGGVGFVGSFSWGDDSPAFVFSALLNNNVKNIAEAISHEAGHTLGLYHQSQYDGNCNKITDYNAGVGDGEIGWAPIMGVGYYRNFTLWHNGANSHGCTNYQSDLAVITSSANGFGYRVDDHGGTFTAATVTNFNAGQFKINGVVERTGDQDFIRFTLPVGGNFKLDAVPYNVGSGNAGSDLDMQVTLYGGSQQVLDIYNPGALLNSLVDTTLNAGTYYLKVEGRGNQYAPAYASLGSYALEARIATAGNPLPLRTLELSGTLRGDRHQLNWIIDADEAVTNLVLEASADGRSFQALANLATGDRSYGYRPPVAGTVLYRLNVTFDNGRQYYSNVISIRQDGSAAAPKLVSNTWTGDALKVNSPGRYDYQLLDYSGRLVARGQLTNGLNTLNIHTATSGLYIIRFTDGTNQWTDKLLKP